MGKGSRDLAGPVLLVPGLLVLLLCVLATTSGEGVTWPGIERDAPAATTDESADEVAEQVEDVEEESTRSPDRSAHRPVALLPGRLAGAVLLGAVVLLVVALLLRLRLSLRGRRPRQGRLLQPVALDAPVLDPPPDDDIADALSEGLADLAAGTPRNSIVAAWLRLEAAAESERFHRDPADTPSEYVAHVLASYAMDEDAIDRLAALYREARFSEHPLGEAQRAEAVACLTTLLAGLPAGPSARRPR